MRAGAGRGGLGWAILAAALAVPGVLYFYWWSHLKVDRVHAISAKAIKRADGEVFQTPPPSVGRLVNPMAASAGAPSGLPPAAATPVGTTPVRTGAAAMPAGGSPAGKMPDGTMPRRTLAGTLPAAASAAPLPSTATIVLPRDPMMSPLDAVRLQEAALAEEERLRALKEASRPRVKRAVKIVKAPIQSRIELQGISSTAEGDNLAMIDDARVSVGESFSVRNYPGKVRVLKITESEVTMEYKGRKFKMRVNAE